MTTLLTKNNKTILLSNLLVSILLLTIFLITRHEIFSGIFAFLYKIYAVPMTFSISYLDYLIVSFIPVWTIPLYINKEKSLSRVLLTNIIAALILFATVLVCYYIGDKLVETSPFLPLYIISVPFSNYLTFSLFIGVLTTYLINSKTFRQRLLKKTGSS